MRTSASFLLAVGVSLAQSQASKASDASAAPPKTAAASESKLPAGASARLQWNLRVFVEDYARVGHKDAKWDAAAKKALEVYARREARVADADDDPNARLDYLEPLNEAVRAGCTDPLVRYLKLRASTLTTTKSQETAALYRAVAQDMAASGYSDLLKFNAAASAAQALNSSAKTGSTVPKEVHQLRQAASSHLKALVQDPQTPVETLVNPFDVLMELTRRNKAQFEPYYRALEPALFQNWESSHVPLLIQGRFFTKWAWVARGGGYANTVTEQGFKLFEERLDLAEKSLESAWVLNPNDERIALAMMTVEMGQGKGRTRMELWFKRAMDINPNSWSACSHKMLYLEPKWFGTPGEMLAFGRQCVDSEEWGGSVPIMLSDAHKRLAKYLDTPEMQARYWGQPQVWADVKASWEEFGKLNPGHRTWRQSLANDAYLCGKFEEFNALLKDEKVISYGIFGGKAEFEKMRAAAESKEQSK